MPIPKLPVEIATLFGERGSEKFVDFLNQAFFSLQEDLVAMSSVRFEHRLSAELAVVRLETAELRADMAEMRTELKTEMAGLRTEMAEMRTELKTEMAGLRTEMAELRTEMKTEMADLRTEVKTDSANLRSEMKSEFAAVHREISGLTRWILAAIVAFTVIYPAINLLLEKVLSAH